jgi:uncharacterized protein (DUF1501 family)
MDRRTLLTAALSAPALAVAGRAWSAPASDQRLLVVFLRGGYDAMNVVIPTGSDFYYQARPTLRIARPDPANPTSALPLDSDWSLHPALRETIYPLWQKQQVAFVPFAGPDDLSRSHFETQDTIELGQPVNGSRNYRSGFMSRLNAQLAGGRPIGFTAQPTLAFDGPQVIANIAMESVGKPGVDDRRSKLIEDMYRGQTLSSAVAAGFSVRTKAYEALSGEMIAANRNAVSPSGFELATRRIARLMRDEYNLAFVDVGGWDTHVNQGAATGVLADRIGALGRGLAGFADDLGPDIWAKTTVIVISEFGRTFRENGDKGTDHGHGSVYWVLGGSVKGGRIAGEQVSLQPGKLNQDRDLLVLTDYRALIGGIVSRVYGMSSQGLSTVFPAIQPIDLGLA